MCLLKSKEATRESQNRRIAEPVLDRQEHVLHRSKCGTLKGMNE